MTRVIKAEIYAATKINGGHIVTTVFNLEKNDETKSLLSYLRPMVNDFVRRRVLPVYGERKCEAHTQVKIRESKSGQNVEINWLKTGMGEDK